MSEINVNIIKNLSGQSGPTLVGTSTVTGDLNVTGAITGNGIGITNLPSVAAIGTALSVDTTSPLSKIYYTSPTLGVASTITVDPPGTKVAYTNFPSIIIEGDADLIIADGDDLMLDILGISTD
jgi:hypothetical protein